MTFFLDWDTEYQYFFVFASLFLVIFGTGHVKNFLEKRRIHRHLKDHGFLAESNSMTREEQIAHMGRDQLFGINQLLYGHYTDGVHVVYSSFNNTPVNSQPGSRNPSRSTSPTGIREFSGGGPGPSSAAFRESQFREAFLQPAKAERKVESYSPEPLPSPRSTSRPPPASRSYAARKYTPSRLSQHLDSSDLGLMSTSNEDNGPENRVSDSYSHKSGDSQKSGESSDHSGSTGATSLEIPHDDGMSAMSSSNGADLRHLSNHRVSHAAEIGQFPRRKAAVAPTQQVEKNRKAAYKALTTESEDEDDVVVPTRPRPTPHPSAMSLGPSDLNPFGRGPFDTPESSRTPSFQLLEDITPTEELKAPLLEFTAPTPERRREEPIRTYSPRPMIVEEGEQTSTPATYSPMPLARTYTEPIATVVEPEPAHPHAKPDPTFEHRPESEVFRRVNANFEVSRAGKKLDMTEAMELGELGLHSEFDWDDDGKRQSKKLQKKKPERSSTEKPSRPSMSSDKRRSSWFHFSHPNRRSTVL